ncbi:hypothetical protein KEJ50_06065 [Candidatus Bathyarchaeota archaeon]|nr:hypothetical protein [Candidatus Bathyarchaeota archaeon]
MSISPELYETIIRIIDQRVSEIKVTREDFNRLTKIVEALAEAQKRTESVIATLGERVERLEKAVEALAEAQKRTEESVSRLAAAVGSLSDAIGYGLEDVAKVMLPSWLEKHEKVKVKGLERRFIKVDGEEVEANLYGEGVKGRYLITVIGEVKSKIDVGDVKKFMGNLDKIRKALKERKILPLMFGYWFHPSASALGKKNGIRVIAPYQKQE